MLLGATDEELVVVRLLYVLKEPTRQYAFSNTAGFSATYFLQESMPLRPVYMGQPDWA